MPLPSTQTLTRRRLRSAGLILAGLAVFQAVSSALAEGSLAERVWSDACWTLISGAAMLKCGATARRQRETHLRVAWLCFTLGALAWFLGILKWDYDELVSGRLTPFPSEADLGFLATPILLVAGYVAYKKHQPSTTMTLKNVGDVGVVACVLVMAATLMVYAPAEQYNDPPVYVVTALAYPILHLTALVVGLICLWQHVWGQNRVILSIHLTGLGSLAIIATLYASSLLLHRYQTGNALDVGWVLTFGLLIWSSYEEDALPTALEPEEPRGLPHLDALVPALAVGSLALVAAIYNDRWIAPLVPIWIVAGLGLGLFLGLRTWCTHEIERTLAEKIVHEQERRRKAEGALYDVQKMEAVGTLAGGVAHEFKNLLTGMSAGLSLARRQLHRGQDATGALEVVEHSIWRASDVTSLLLDLARRREPDKRDVSPVQSLARIVPLLAKVMPQGIEVEWTPSPNAERLTTRVDVGLLEQALLNLALNARDAMPSGGKLTFKLSQRELAGARAGRWVTIAVSDTGVGIPPELLGRVFEPFFTSKPRGQGTGLGLAMVRAFADEHGGWVEVESEPDKGATFTIGLPISDLSADRSAIPRGTEGEGVLVVGKSTASLLAAKGILDASGFSTTAAGSGAEALAELERQSSVRVVVADAALEDVGAVELMRRMRARGLTQPVILASSFAVDESWREHEFIAVVHKPFDPAELTRVVRRVIDGVA